MSGWIGQKVDFTALAFWHGYFRRSIRRGSTSISAIAFHYFILFFMCCLLCLVVCLSDIWLLQMERGTDGWMDGRMGGLEDGRMGEKYIYMDTSSHLLKGFGGIFYWMGT